MGEKSGTAKRGLRKSGPTIQKGPRTSVHWRYERRKESPKAITSYQGRSSPVEVLSPFFSGAHP